MVMHKNVPYIRCRDGIYYFVRRVPDDVKSYYSSDRISMSLRTKSNGVAIRATKSICQRLDDYWLGFRLQKIDLPAIHLASSREELDDDSPNKEWGCRILDNQSYNNLITEGLRYVVENKKQYLSQRRKPRQILSNMKIGQWF